MSTRSSGFDLPFLMSALERRVEDLSHNMLENALLSSASQWMVLPQPAVGLLALTAREVVGPLRGVQFRAEGLGGGSPDLLLTAVSEQFSVLPWTVCSTSWIDDADVVSGLSGRSGPMRARGLRIELLRPGHAVSPPRVLTLAVTRLSRLLSVDRCRAVWEGRRVPCRSAALPVSLGKGATRLPTSLLDHIDLLTENILEIETPSDPGTRDRASLEILFEEAQLVPDSAEPPTAVTNVIPVWNSIRASYPGFYEIGQTVSEVRRLVHPLRSDLGSEWSAWFVRSIGAAGESRSRWHWDQAERLALGRMAPFPSFHLTYTADLEGKRGDRSGETLSVVLSDETRGVLDADGLELYVDYALTTGAAGNGWLHGTEFRAMDSRGIHLPQFRGALLGTTWGGSRGVDLTRLDGATIRALLSEGAVRTVDDVSRVLDERYGDLIVLHDERDLLRLGIARSRDPLSIRVRFRDRGFPEGDRPLVLRAITRFLQRYLARNPVGAFRLHEVGAGMSLPSTN